MGADLTLCAVTAPAQLSTPPRIKKVGGRHIPDKLLPRKGCWESTPCCRTLLEPLGGAAALGVLRVSERFSAEKRRGDLHQEKPFLGWDGILPKGWLKGIQDTERRNQG